MSRGFVHAAGRPELGKAAVALCILRDCFVGKFYSESEAPLSQLQKRASQRASSFKPSTARSSPQLQTYKW